MLNYIWAGLIIIGVFFALWQDGGDFRHDRYRNGEAIAVEIMGLPPGYLDQEPTGRIDVQVNITPTTYLEFFDPIDNHKKALDPEEAKDLRDQIETYLAEPIDAQFVTTDSGRELHIAFGELAPYPLDVIFDAKKDDYGRLPSDIMDIVSDSDEPTHATARIKLGHVGFVTVKTVTAAMFKKAEAAIALAISLVGVIALWMGLMKIAEDAKLIDVFVKLVRPVLGPLFPQIPKDHPALGLIAINLAANMLALGNAATPLGIKAMESLQELNKEKDTATDSMVMLLAMNTASVQLLPPVTLIAIMGLAATELFLPIFLVTLISLAVAITSAKLLGRMRMFKKTDPMRPNNPNAQKGGAA